MQLLRASEIPESEVVRKIGYRPWAALFMMGIFVALPVVLGGASLFQLARVSWVVRIIGGAVMLLGGLIWLLVMSCLWTAAQSCFRRSNWLMKLTERGVYLQIRSYMNYHFPEDGPTAVYIPFDEIESIHKTTIKTFRPNDHDRSHDVKLYLDIHLNHVDTEALREAAMKEVAREGPKGRVMSSRANHAPVIVPHPNVVRIDWRGRGMLRAMKALRPELVVEGQRRITSGDVSDSPEKLDNLILSAAESGEKIAAIKLVRQRYPEMGLAEAKRFIENLMDEMAEPTESAA